MTNKELKTQLDKVIAEYCNNDIIAIKEAVTKWKPQLELEPKTGRWLAKSFHELYCDNCGFDFDIMKNEFIDKMKYCPNCGARMKSEGK